MVLERIPQMQSKHNLAIVNNGLLTASRASELLPDAQLYLFGGLVREHSVAPVMGTAARVWLGSPRTGKPLTDVPLCHLAYQLNVSGSNTP